MGNQRLARADPEGRPRVHLEHVIVSGVGGSDIVTPAAQAVVTDCHVEADSRQTVVTVDLCCG